MIRADLRVRALLEAGRMAEFALASLRDRHSPLRAVALCSSACDNLRAAVRECLTPEEDDLVHGT